MKTFVQDWLESRLGIVIDLSKGNFERVTKDGTLLAKTLYSYGIIPLQILNNIKSSKNVNDCFKNLKILKPWLEYIELPVTDEVLYEIASGQGNAALHLFYAVYVLLMPKDKLFFLSLQKERVNSFHFKRQIKVERVPEQYIATPQLEFEDDKARPLIEKQYMIAYHKEKCNEILEKIKCMKEKYAKSMSDVEPQSRPAISMHATSRKLYKPASEIENVEKDVKAFESKFVPCSPDLDYQELIELQNRAKSTPLKPVPDIKEARRYVNCIKQKTRRGILAQAFQEEMQASVIDELWKSIKSRQEKKFEEMICKNLLKQSHYEKLMCTKLALARHQKEVAIRNRQIVERLKVKHVLQKDYEESMNCELEFDAEDAFDMEFERQRLSELHKRIYVEKVKLKFQERLEEARSILDKLIDIAVRISEFRETYASELPKHLLKDMKELFFKNLPIFDILTDAAELYNNSRCSKSVDKEDKPDLDEMYYTQEEENDFGVEDKEFPYGTESDECLQKNDFESAKTREFIRQEVLNECDFNDYLHLLGPWMTEDQFAEDFEPEVSQSILGYMVHKVLAGKYPYASAPVPKQIKPMSVRAIVQGSSDENACSMLTDLLSLRNIVVVRVDDAINFVLRAYKQEISAVRDIDITFQQATKNAFKGKGGIERTKEPSKKELLLAKESVPLKQESVLEPQRKEISTQTPRNIPEDDPLLSSNAEIGKTAFESLGIGDPVPDVTVISSLIAYIASLQDDYDGWVLWNYPVLYSQASKLESALTGYQLISIGDEMDTVEGLEGFGCRGNCQNPYDEDEFAEKRLSRLVPKPEWNTTPEKAESYFTSFVKLRKKSLEAVRSNATFEFHAQSCLEKLYMEQKIFHCFEYTSLTFQTVKDIGKAILQDDVQESIHSGELVAKSSLEIFGDGLTQLNDKYNPPKRKEKDSKRTVEPVKKGKDEREVPVQLQEVERKVEEEETAKPEKEKEVKKLSDNVFKIPKPGDPNWERATGSLSDEIQISLAKFWENHETVFIEDFKYIFFCLRVHRANTVKYTAFLKKTLQNFLRREDTKQSILNDFQLKFNDIDDDLRPDVDVKCELHVRVSELEESLLERADDRKENSENYRMKFVNDNWMTNELSNLVNLYIRALQLEINRCTGTCQFINDYYMSMLQKLPQEKVLPKIHAPTLSIEEEGSSAIPCIPLRPQDSAKTLRKSTVSRKGKNEKGVTRSRSIFRSMQQSEAISLPGRADAIMNILTNLSFPSEGTPFHDFFLSNVADVRASVKELVEGCIAESRKGCYPGGGASTKEKKKTAESRTQISNQLNSEWTEALEAELSRFQFRAQLIQNRGILEFNDFISTILNTFASINDEIEKIFNKEVFSISECCKVFRCAIEEEVAIQPLLELKVDEFTINEDHLLFPNAVTEVTSAGSNFCAPLQFTLEQLTFIFQKLNYVTPDGEIVRRAFLYILEDLRVMKSEDGRPRLLPNLWDDLNPDDLPFIFDRIYQRIEIVNWKDFLIYALEIPMPTDVEILNMRSSFRFHDPSNSELMNFKTFLEIGFWFENYSIRFDVYELKEFLFRLYQVDEGSTNYTALLLALCKDEDAVVGFLKALSLVTGKRILIDEFDGEFVSKEGEELIDDGELTTETDSVDTGKTTPKCKQSVRHRCDCKQPSIDNQSEPEVEEAGESYRFYYGSRFSTDSFYTSDISHEVIRKVLMASYPSLTNLSILLHCSQTFEDTVNTMLKNLSMDGATVKISRLLNYKFIKRLLTSTNKFKIVDVQNIVKTITEDRKQNLTSQSVQWL